MQLPEIVNASYAEIKSIVNEIKTTESVDGFVSILNKCIPAKTDSSYQLVKCMYNSDKWRFLLFITGCKELQSLVLWTSSDDIINHFQLSEKIILEWDEQTHKFNGRLINEQPTTRPVSPKVAQQTKIHIPEDEDEEMERVYEYMQSRLAQLRQV